MAVVLAGPQGWPGQWGRHDNVHDGPGEVRVPALEAGEGEDRPRASAATPQAHRAVAAGVGCREDRWHVSQSSFCWVLDPATLSSSWVLVIFATAGRVSVVCGSLLFLFSFCYWGLNLWPLACWYCCSAKLGSQNLTRGVLGRCALRLSHLDSPYSPPLKLCMDECFVCMCMFVHCVHAWYPQRLPDKLVSYCRIQSC